MTPSWKQWQDFFQSCVIQVELSQRDVFYLGESVPIEVVISPAESKETSLVQLWKEYGSHVRGVIYVLKNKFVLFQTGGRIHSNIKEEEGKEEQICLRLVIDGLCIQTLNSAHVGQHLDLMVTLISHYPLLRHSISSDTTEIKALERMLPSRSIRIHRPFQVTSVFKGVTNLSKVYLQVCVKNHHSLSETDLDATITIEDLHFQLHDLDDGRIPHDGALDAFVQPTPFPIQLQPQEKYCFIIEIAIMPTSLKRFEGSNQFSRVSLSWTNDHSNTGVMVDEHRIEWNVNHVYPHRGGEKAKAIKLDTDEFVPLVISFSGPTYVPLGQQTAVDVSISNTSLNTTFDLVLFCPSSSSLQQVPDHSTTTDSQHYRQLLRSTELVVLDSAAKNKMLVLEACVPLGTVALNGGMVSTTLHFLPFESGPQDLLFMLYDKITDTYYQTRETWTVHVTKV